jgi:quercetin dioxygenase-like cupin family protein
MPPGESGCGVEMWSGTARKLHAPCDERYPSDVTDAEWNLITPLILLSQALIPARAHVLDVATPLATRYSCIAFCGAKKLDGKMAVGSENHFRLFASLDADTLLDCGLSGSAQGFKRTMLLSAAFPGTQYITALYLVEVDAGAHICQHTHPGLETLYILEGEANLVIEGMPEKHLKPGDSARVPTETVHSVTALAKPLKLLITYVLEKNRPLATSIRPL